MIDRREFLRNSALAAVSLIVPASWPLKDVVRTSVKEPLPYGALDVGMVSVHSTTGDLLYQWQFCPVFLVLGDTLKVELKMYCGYDGSSLKYTYGKPVTITKHENAYLAL